MNTFSTNFPKSFSKLFHRVYFVIWTLMLPGIFAVNIYQAYQLLIPVILIGAILFIGYKIKARRKKTSSRVMLHKRIYGRAARLADHHSFMTYCVLLFILQILLQLFFLNQLAIYPTSDRKIIFEQASVIADSHAWHTTPEYNYYFLRYPNNHMILILEAGYFSFLKMLGIHNYLRGNMILNLICIDLAILLCICLVYRRYGKKFALLFQLMSVLFISFYTFVPFVYSDTLTLPIIAALLLCYQLLEEHEEHGKQAFRMFLLFIMAILTWMGFKLKPTAAIITIACVMHRSLTVHWKKGLALLLAVIITFTITDGAFNYTVEKIDLVDDAEYDKENFPYTHWVMMGLSTYGTYTKEDRQYTSSFATKAEKQSANIAMIQTRLKEYGVGGLLVHQYIKAIKSWSDGTYHMDWYLSRMPLKNTWMQKFIFEDGKYHNVFWFITAITLFFLAAMLFFSLKNGCKDGNLDSTLVWKLSLFGLFLFLSFWETTSRYIMHFSPLMLLIAVDTIARRVRGD